MKTADLRKYRKNAEALEAVDRLLSKRMVADNVQASRGAPDFALTLRKIENYSQDKGTYSLLQTQRELIREQTAITTYISGVICLLHRRKTHRPVMGSGRRKARRGQPRSAQKGG